MDSVRDSGVVQFHGVDDGTRVKVSDWRQLRYISAGLTSLPPHCVTVKLGRAPPPETELVKIHYLGSREGSIPSSCLSVTVIFTFPGYPFVQLTDITSDVLSEETTDTNFIE